MSFLDGDLRGYAAQTLAMLDGHLPPAALDAILEGLARAPGIVAFPMTTAALRLAVPRGAPDPLPPGRQLTGPQQRVVHTLAGLGPDTWRWADFTSILRAWNLPATQAGCRSYAGLDAP